MDKEAKKTDQLIQIYKDDPVRENLNALIHQVQRTVFLVPAMLPGGTDVEELKRQIRQGGGVLARMPEGVRPIPCILKNKDGKSFFPIYTSQGQIPKEPKYDVIMNMPFASCLALALHAKLGAEGIAVNPFSDNLLFRRRLLEEIRKGAASGGGAKPVPLTPQQLSALMRQKAETHDFPMRVFKEGTAFIQRLCDEKEALVSEIYRGAWQKPELCPYREGDFSVMPLNISEELLLIQIDLPAAKAAPCCCRIYVTQNPKTEEARYFMIEQGKEKGERKLCGVDAGGKRLDYGEAPVESTEIQRVMDLVKQEQERRS